MGKKRTKDEEMLRSFKVALRDLMYDSEGKVRVTAKQVAHDLGVSRQMVYRYLEGETFPRSDVLVRAFRKFGIKLRYRDHDVTVDAFPVAAAVPEFQPVQGELFAALDALSTRDLEIRITRKEPTSVEFAVTVRFAG